MMNEKIKELAEQAHVYAGGHSLWCHAGEVEKFAELIVRECMMICGAIQGAGEVRDMSDFASGAAQCRAIIKRDFGVD